MSKLRSVQLQEPLNITGSLHGTASWAENALTASYAVSSSLSTDVVNKAFLRNETSPSVINTIKSHESIFNPSNLKILNSDIFIIEQNAEYYVLDTVINSGSMIVSGTIHIGGPLLNNGVITGPGIVE